VPIMSRGVMVSISAYAIAILVVIAGFFLLDIDKIALYFWAFGSLVFSLSVSMISTVILVSKKTTKDVLFFNTGFGSVIWIYQVLVIISVLFINSFRHHVGAFVFLEIAIFAIFIVISGAVQVSSKHIYVSNQKSQEKLNNSEYNKPRRGGF
jgi:hypothetical protein